MRISDRYIGRQVIFATFIAILFLSAILVMGTVVQQIRMLLVEFGASLQDVGKLILAALPFSLIYTMPWAFLTAVLLVYGRMSKDQEITGFRVSGMSLARLSAPVFVIAAVLSVLCLWLNTEISPRAAAQEDKIRIDAFMDNPLRVLNAAVEQDALDRIEGRMEGLKAYMARVDDRLMDHVHVFRTATAKKPGSTNLYIYARQAEPDADKIRKEFRFHLHDAIIVTSDAKGLPRVTVANELEPMVMPYEVNEEKVRKSRTLTNQGIRDYLVSDAWTGLKLNPEIKAKAAMRYLGEIPRRFATSFACLAFACIGVPLGISSRRRDTSTGLLISLLIGTAYFAVSNINGHSAQEIVTLAWLPNILCAVLDVYLFRRASRR